MSELKVHSVFRRLLKERSLTLGAVAKATGVPKSTLSTWLVAGSKPSDPTQIRAVSNFFGLGMTQFLFDEPEQELSLEALKTEMVLDGLYRIRLERVVAPKKGERPK